MTRQPGSPRRGLVFGAMVGAGVLALSSAALACIAFEGKMKVDRGTTSSTVIGSGSGSHAYCSISGGATANPGDTVTVTVSPYTNTGPTDPCASTRMATSDDPPLGTGTFTPNTYLPDPMGYIADCILTLPALNVGCVPLGAVQVTQNKGVGPYEVRFTNGGVFDRTRGANPTYTHVFGTNSSCMLTGGSYTVLGSLNVDATGNGSWTGALPSTGLTADGPTDSSGICVRATLAGGPLNQPRSSGNQAPIVIL